MSEDGKRRGLGRGLSALMADIEPPAATPAAADASLPIELIRRNPDQPRRTFQPEQIADLAASIREKGVIQPIIVRRDPADPDLYQIVAGERRWRAAQEAQLHEVPVVVREFDDREMLEIAIIENVQRVDLNPMEEALGFQQLMDRFQHTQDQVAKALGKSRSHVANQLRLLNLAEPLQALVRNGSLSAGHARVLLTATDPGGLADQILAQGLSVREAERLGKKGPAAPRKSRAAAVPAADPSTSALAADLTSALGMPVAIDHAEDGAGHVTIRYADLTELDELCEALSQAGLTLFTK